MGRNRLSELPTDLRQQDQTPGLPPIWSDLDLLSRSGAKLSCNLETLRKLKNLPSRPGTIECATPSSIPWVVRKYTKVSPLSPFFRQDIPKFGFGTIDFSNGIVGTLGVIAGVLLIKKFLVD